MTLKTLQKHLQGKHPQKAHAGGRSSNNYQTEQVARFKQEDRVSMTSDIKGSISFGGRRDGGVYNFDLKDNSVKVLGSAKLVSGTLNQEFSNAEKAIGAIKDHYGTGERSFIKSGSKAWFKKYPETKTLAD